MEIDWYEVAMAILNEIDEAEAFWPLSEEIKERVLLEYEAWRVARKSGG